MKEKLQQLLKEKAFRKTIVYRILGVSSGFLISYGIFRTVEVCILLTVTIEIVHTAIYYIIEKLWE